VAVLGGPAHAGEMLERGGSVVIASLDRGFARQLGDALGAARLDISITTDVTGVELAGAAKSVATLAAAAAASHGGPDIAGAAAGKVFAELDALARVRGGRPETFTGLAGTGALVASVVAAGSRNHRAGELLAQGVPASEIDHVIGHGAEAVDSVPMLATAAREAHLDSPTLDGLAALVEGRINPEQWAATVTEPPPSKRQRPIRAA
jgi:glycerol-3-phosphate dehydrogenase (NAD(P)+)